MPREPNAQGAQKPGSIPAPRLLGQEMYLSAPRLLHPQIEEPFMRGYLMNTGEFDKDNPAPWPRGGRF